MESLTNKLADSNIEVDSNKHFPIKQILDEGLSTKIISNKYISNGIGFCEVSELFNSLPELVASIPKMEYLNMEVFMENEAKDIIEYLTGKSCIELTDCQLISRLV